MARAYEPGGHIPLNIGKFGTFTYGQFFFKSAEKGYGYRFTRDFPQIDDNSSIIRFPHNIFN